jgi:hypothetical protein
MDNDHITMSNSEAEDFAHAWMQAWNAHDADAIAAHYHPYVEYFSPFVARLSANGRLRGRAAVRDYCTAALERYPDLHFGPEVCVANGANSISMIYRSVEDLLAVETLVLDEHRLVTRALCHYGTGAPGTEAALRSLTGHA